MYDPLVDHTVRGAPGRDHEVERRGDLGEVTVGRESGREVCGSVSRRRGPASRGVAKEVEPVEGAALGGVGPREAADGGGIAGVVGRGGEGGEEAEDEVRASGAEGGAGSGI